MSKRPRPEAPATSWIVEGGLRKVLPYDHEYKSNAKGRWLGRTILDVFTTEFVDMSADYYRRAIDAGRITVNEKPVAATYVVRNGDRIGNRIYRHEPPVSADPIDILHHSDTLVVINKPGSIPVHPSGRYRYNTVVMILQYEMNMGQLHPVHRLDRLTSGVLILGRTKEATREAQAKMTEGSLRKEYLCRVLGEFPSDEEVEVNQPIQVFSHKLGLNAVQADGKPCTTFFRRLSYNGITSVVHCRPVTGRTHQIRVHLQWLGYPIANDPLYFHPAWGAAMGKGGLTRPELDAVAAAFARDKAKPAATTESAPQPLVDGSGAVPAADPARSAPTLDPAAGLSAHRDPLPHELLVWLHASRYAGDDVSYEAPRPSWAAADFSGDRWLQEPDACARFQTRLKELAYDDVQTGLDDVEHTGAPSNEPVSEA